MSRVYTQQVHLRVTPGEARLLTKLAKQAGKGVSEYLRDLVKRAAGYASKRESEAAE